MLDIFIIFLVSILLSYSFIVMFSKAFYKLDIIDNPKKYKKKRSPIPYGMGIIFFLIFFIVSYFFIEHNYKLFLLWFFGFVVTIISFVDDRMNINAKIRLIIQIIIGAIIGITSIKIGYVSNLFGGIINLETYYIEILSQTIYLIPLLFTVLWYVFIFNALNWTDGIQGNTSGIGLISFLILFILGIILFNQDDYSGGIKNAKFIMQLAIILVGMLIPFMYFEIKEKILMGDTGTMFLGFMLASLAIISGGKIATVLVVFGIYAVDAVYVIVKRLIKNKNPLKGDFTHLHHRLMDIGIKKNQVLIIVFSLSFFFGITALFLDKIGKIIVFIIIIFVVIFINEIIRVFKKEIGKISKSKKKAFSLAEIIIVISILIIISTPGVFYFTKHIDDLKFDKEIKSIEKQLEVLDGRIQRKQIFDYEVNFIKGENYYYVNENIFDINKKIEIKKIDNNIVEIGFNGINSGTGIIKYYKEGKFQKSKDIIYNEVFTGSFNEYNEYTIKGIIEGKELNTIKLRYFDENKELKIKNIDTNTNSDIEFIKIINILGKKQFGENEENDRLEIKFENKNGKTRTIKL